jgi:hypothetical protein
MDTNKIMVTNGINYYTEMHPKFWTVFLFYSRVFASIRGFPMYVNGLVSLL